MRTRRRQRVQTLRGRDYVATRKSGCDYVTTRKSGCRNKRKILGGSINNDVDTTGQSALHIAVREGNLSKVQELLDTGANVNKQASSGATPLFIASENGRLDIVKILLAIPGIDVNKSTTSGATPLYIACQKAYVEIVKTLLAVPGIDVNKKTNSSATSLYFA